MVDLKNLRVIPAACLLAAIFAASPLRAQEGTLRFGSMQEEANRYSVPIMLSGGQDQVSALNFRLQYDPAVFRPVSVESGAAASQANKVIVANSPSPGNYVVVMMGLNQTTVPQGEVARVLLERVGSSENGQSELVIQEPTLSTPGGMELPSRGMSRTVELDKADTPSTPGETPEGEGSPDESPESPAPSETPVDQPEGSGAPAPGGSSPGTGGLFANNNMSPSQVKSGPSGSSAGPVVRSSVGAVVPAGVDSAALDAQVSEVNRLREGIPTPGGQATPEEGLPGPEGRPVPGEGFPSSQADPQQRERMAALVVSPAGKPNPTAYDISESGSRPSTAKAPTFSTIILLIMVIIGLACGAALVVKFRRSG